MCLQEVRILPRNCLKGWAGSMTPVMTSKSVWKRSSSWIPKSRCWDQFLPDHLAVAGWQVALLADARCVPRLRFPRLVHQETHMSIPIGWQGWTRDHFRPVWRLIKRPCRCRFWVASPVDETRPIDRRLNPDDWLSKMESWIPTPGTASKSSLLIFF